jgi:hypothetical protein
MPRVRRQDSGAGDSKATGGSVPPLPMPPGAPLQHAGVRHRPDWPFLYTWTDGAFWLNRAPRRKPDIPDVGVALW